MSSNLKKLWRLTKGDPEICVAVIDGNTDLSHNCFKGANVSQVSMFGGSGEEKPSAHGTHVSSVIFGQHHSKIKGVAPSAKGIIIPLYAANTEGSVVSATQLDLARAINKAIEQGAHVINISGGELDDTGEPEGMLASALKQCEDSNILVVAAAGNNGCKCLHVPAASPSVLAVGATNNEGTPMPFSNYGEAYQMNGILAPGVKVSGAVPEGGITQSSGTSYAAPIVSGIAALLLSIQKDKGQDINPSAVRKALIDTAIPCPDDGKVACVRFLSGSLNIDGAMTQLFGDAVIEPSELARPSPSITSEPIINTTEQSSLNHIKNMSSMNNLIDTNQEEATQVSPSGIEMSELQEFNPADQHGILPQAIEASHDETDAHNHSHEENVKVEATPILKASEVTPSELTPSDAQVNPSEVDPSDCGCGGGKKKEGKKKGGCGCSGGSKKKQIVYAIGTLGYDFVTETKRDGFIQSTGGNVHDPAFMLSYLRANPWAAQDIIWTLNQELTPIYAVYPVGPFGEHTYSLLLDFLDHQINNGVERVSIPGIVGGKLSLLSGQSVPVIVPNIRGMSDWSTEALVSALGYTSGTSEHNLFTNFLERVYYELRNFGTTPSERAINYSATNAFIPGQILQQAISQGMELSDITAEKSPIGRPGTATYDVKLTFFDPTNRFEKARKVYRSSVDVSDVIPVSVGTVRSWSVY